MISHALVNTPNIIKAYRYPVTIADLFLHGQTFQKMIKRLRQFAKIPMDIADIAQTKSQAFFKADLLIDLETFTVVIKCFLFVALRLTNNAHVIKTICHPFLIADLLADL